MNEQELARDIKAMNGRVQSARHAVRKGKVVDISFMGEECQRLCQSVEALPAAASSRLRPSLMALMEEVETLSQALRAALSLLREQMEGSGDRRKAMKAYGRAEGEQG